MKSLIRILIFSLLISFLLPIFPAKAQNELENGPVWLSASGQKSSDLSNQSKAKTISDNALDVVITFSGVWADVQIENGEDFTKLWHDDFGNYRQPGQPALPGKTFNILIPNGAQVEVLSQTFTSEKFRLSDYALPTTIIPAQIQVSKSEPPPPWTQPDPQHYGSPNSFPHNWYELKDTFQMRDYTIQPIWINPVRYSPGQGEIEILEQIELRLTWQASSLDEVKSVAVSDSPSFDRLVSQIVINPPALPMYDTKEETGEGYLIITPDEFEEEVQDFAAFKQNQGYEVTIAKFSDTGSTAISIKNFINNAYNDWIIPPTYLLLVGDTLQNNDQLITLFPAFDGKKIYQKTDLYYGTVGEISDFVPDIFVGRIPARTETDVTNMLNKIMAYTNDGFLSWHINTAFIATCDKIKEVNSLYYHFEIAENSHNHVIREHTRPLSYPSFFPLLNSLPGGDQLYCVSNSATSLDITKSINSSRGLITYSGHGSVDGWDDGNINIKRTDLSALLPLNVSSFVSSFACYTNDFGNTSNTFPDVFGETWLLQQSKGAVGFFGSAAPSYWNQDNILEITMFDHLYSDPLKPPSIREAINVGLLALEENYLFQDLGGFQYYLESYNLLGDPSQKLWLYPDDPYYFITQITEDEQSGLIGSTVEYPINLINYGDEDSFTIGIANNTWPVTSTNLSEVPTKTSLPLTISVEIPLSALPNDTDQVEITIKSTNSLQISSIELTTTAIGTFFTHLPLIFR